jgi:hypothetical protein
MSWLLRNVAFHTSYIGRVLIQITGFFLFIHTGFAQVTVSGAITDEHQQPLRYVVISMRQGTAIVSNTLSDSTGAYRFSNLKKGSYTFVFSLISYRDTIIPVTINNDTVIHAQLQKGRLLQAVEVRAQKPLIQMETDRLRFNVAGTSLVFGNNIWDVIEKTPLVTASSDGTIQISGTSGAVVYFNNKRKVLSGTALKAYLSAIPSDNLEAIEVMTTPSSKYDAEGGAGILNIITKKKKDEGWEGNASATMRQTAVNSQSGSVFLNGRKGRWDVYSNAYLVNRRRQPNSTQDVYFPPGTTTSLLTRSISADGTTGALSAGMNVGIDYQINPDHVAGLIFDYAGNRDKKNRDAYSREHYLDADSLSFSNNTDRLTSHTYSLNLNYEGKLDSTGKKLTADVDILHYTSTNNSVSRTDALDTVTLKFLSIQDYFRSASPQQVNNQSVKTDLHLPVNKRLSVDAGVKISLSQINNDLLFENYTGTWWVKDYSRSNLFKYNENILAAYAVVNGRLHTKWWYQAGTRVENTIAKGYLEGNRVVDRNYLNVFPTAFLKYTPTQKKSYGLAVSGRITRPSYWDVNPFRTYTTNKAYFEGNPFLQPSTYYREELSHTLYGKKATYTFQVAASQTLNEFYSLPYEDSTGVIVNKRTNYGDKYSYSASALYYSQLQPWWQLQATVLTGYVLSKGNYSDIPINNRSFLLSLSANQTFTLSKKRRLTCNVIANNTLPFTVVNTRVGDRLDTEIRIRKTTGAFNFTLSATDLFKTNKDRYIVHADDLKIVQNYYNDTRSVAFILSYNFGKSTVRKKRDRDAEFENVKGRIM